ncbi:hypothetical protein AwDysgo_08250 [Bacteroidales bacterium]|nr:hypothetical protein AwDysgo_08250 [Bacteroidales bacterium]
MNSKYKNYLFYISAILLLISSALHFTQWAFIPYVYAVAGAGLAVTILSSPYEGKNFRVKRLRFPEIIGAIMLPLSSFFMFKGRNEWFLCLSIFAFLQIYIMIVKNKEKEDS